MADPTDSWTIADAFVWLARNEATLEVRRCGGSTTGEIVLMVNDGGWQWQAIVSTPTSDEAIAELLRALVRHVREVRRAMLASPDGWATLRTPG